MYKKILGGLAAAALALSFASPASALGIDIDASGGAFNGFPFTLGWGFDVTSTVTVTDLGFWDEGGDGLVGEHAVGLWSSDGTLLASTVITNVSSAEASASGLGNWLFNSIAPLVLGPGSYQVGALVDGTDAYRSIVNAVTLDPLLSNFTSNLFARGDTLQFMDLQESDAVWNGLFGANLKVVPEPSSLALLGLGLVGIGLARRRRKA